MSPNMSPLDLSNKKYISMQIPEPEFSESKNQMFYSPSNRKCVTINAKSDFYSKTKIHKDSSPIIFDRKKSLKLIPVLKSFDKTQLINLSPTLRKQSMISLQNNFNFIPKLSLIKKGELKKNDLEDKMFKFQANIAKIKRKKSQFDKSISLINNLLTKLDTKVQNLRTEKK